MHTDLSPHLHSEACNELINKLKECHQENAFGRFLGFCNSADSAVVKCLKEERLRRRDLNYKKSLQTKEKLKRLFEQDRKDSGQVQN